MCDEQGQDSASNLTKPILQVPSTQPLLYTLQTHHQPINPPPIPPQEPPNLKQGGAPPPPGWPSSGALTYAKVWASYRPGLPPVLKDLSFALPGGCSCGVVGRTGSGKSSLMLTLFRLISVDGGSIRLDGLDTSKVALDVLRRQLAIIPQDPVLFSGTVRSNLDPWNRHGDAGEDCV